MTKTEWRKRMKQSLLTIDKVTREEKSKAVGFHLLQTEQWKNSKTIGITVARDFELNTSYIIQSAWNEGKRVCVPKCYSKNKKMEFRQLTSFKELENVYMDLYEPVHETKVINPDNIDLLVVPGLVFDKMGYRIGYGGGYYDRYLQHYHGSTVSLAYFLQIGENLPREEFDIPVDFIITEDGRYS